MALVAGVIARAAPAPMMRVATRKPQYESWRPTAAKIANPTAEMARPAPPTSLWPHRSDSVPDMADSGSMTAVIGIRARAATNVL